MATAAVSGTAFLQGRIRGKPASPSLRPHGATGQAASSRRSASSRERTAARAARTGQPKNSSIYDRTEMSKLANMFSALRLDADNDGEEDYRVEVQRASSSTEETATDTNGQNDIISLNNDERILLNSSGDYKMPLVWIDLEMTGLDVTKDRILEIACIITDGKLTKQIEGPDLVISQSKDCLDNMGEWCRTHHAASGLTERVLQSELSEHDAEVQVIDFVRRHVGSASPLLAGNSVYVDLLFLKKYMPQLAAIFSHVIVDVSSIMALCIRWYPKERKQTPRKQKNHRAMDDIRESIAELKYYKDNIFKPQKSKR